MPYFAKKLHNFYNISRSYRSVLVRIHPFVLHVFYFVSLSLIGFGILKSLATRTSYVPRNIDLFFTSVSAASVSSMSTVEMEVFSNSQLVVMTFLMFLGGEVFTSMAGLHLRRSKFVETFRNELNSSPVVDSFNQIVVSAPEPEHVISVFRFQDNVISTLKPFIRHDSVKFLGFVVLGYLLVIHVFGVTLVLIYLYLVSSARDVLRSKGLNTFTFAVFTIVSTFSSCGFVPTNENMIVFRENSGLLWILMPQVLLGNTLFPSCLRFSIWFFGKKFKKSEAEYLLKSSSEIGYLHLLPGLHSMLLVATVFGFILIAFIMFCAMEWNSAALSGLNVYQKLVGALFLSINSRHTGETIVDLSTIAPAILVLFIIMMYLPPYTLFTPVKKDQDDTILVSNGSEKKRRIRDNLLLSQLSYIAIFVILICITERESVRSDPINFSVLNIILEVVSAYGNVGFTTGYGCGRQLTPDPSCEDRWFGFAGKWSDEGKLVLIAVMLLGRLKMFNRNGGRAWKLM